MNRNEYCVNASLLDFSTFTQEMLSKLGKYYIIVSNWETIFNTLIDHRPSISMFLITITTFASSFMFIPYLKFLELKLSNLFEFITLYLFERSMTFLIYVIYLIFIFYDEVIYIYT